MMFEVFGGPGVMVVLKREVVRRSTKQTRVVGKPSEMIQEEWYIAEG